MKIRLHLVEKLLAVLSVSAITVQANSFSTNSTGISIAKDDIARMSSRASLNQPLIQVGDEFWVLAKMTPGPGAKTGVGGYQTFYVPKGAQVVDVAYAQPNPGDPRGFVPIPMKGQSPIAIGDGPSGAKAAVGLTGFTYPAPNVLGINEAPVTAGGISRGTIAGVYADTGIFYSTDPRTAFNSYGAAAGGGSAPMTNSSGDIVGEWDAMNVANATTQGVMTLWDSYQLQAFGRKDVDPIIDQADGRGNAPWGMASAVAGPQSGYQWSFNHLNFTNTVGSVSQKVRAGIEVGPWNRIKYPGSQVGKDQAGLDSNTLGYAGIDASNLGTAVSSGAPLPDSVTAVRFATGQLELGRPEYAAIKVRIVGPPADGSYNIHADAFGGDTGGTDNGKDHIWRFFDPTVVSLQTDALLQNVVRNPLLASGGTTSFTITFANNGEVAMPNVVLTNTLPSGLTYLSSTPAASVAGNVLTWSLGTINPGQLASFTVNVKANTTGSMLSSVTATSNGVHVANAQETVEVGARALLREVNTVTPATVNPGQNVTYTMTVYNEGTGLNGVPLVLTDYLPSGFTYASFVSATLNGAAFTPTIKSGNPRQPTFSVGKAIQPGKSLVIKFNAQVGSGTPNGTYYNQVDLAFEGKRIPPIPEAPVMVGGAWIGDTVFRDWNGNGALDSGEEGLPGVTITLRHDADKNGSYESTIGTTTSDANGGYRFTGLSAGNYQVVAPAAGSGGVPAEYTLTADPDGAAAVNSFNKTLILNEAYLGADWGYRPGGAGIIGDTVYSDVANNRKEDATDPGIPSVTVSLHEDSNGNRIIDAGDVIIATSTTADGTTLDVNGDPIPAGYYEFTGLDPLLKYVVDVDGSDADIATFFGQSYQQSTPDKVAVNPIPSDGSNGFAFMDADFGFFGLTPSTLGDQVYLDVDKNGIHNTGDLPLPNVTVELYFDSNGNGVADEAVFATTTTDINGNYLFSNLGTANYIVKVLASDPDLPAGCIGTLPRYNQMLVPGQVDLDADFPYVRMLEKTVDNPTGVENSILTYTLAPYYPGNTPLSMMQVVDAVPTGTTYVNPSASPAATSEPTDGGTGNVIWNLGSTVAPADGTGTNPGYVPTAITRSTTAEVDDSYIQEDSGGNDWFGDANTILTDPESGKRKAALMKFTLPALSATDVVDRAIIRVMITGARANTAVTMHRLTTNWSEGIKDATTGATWNDPNGTGTAGTWSAGTFSAADYDSAVSYGTCSAPFINGQPLEFDVTNLVRAWRAGTSPNFGIVLIASGTDTGDLTFRSSEGSAANTPGPRLIIGYSQQGSGDFTVRDNFDTVGYNNNDGTRQWNGDWTETGDGGAPGGGSILITGGHLRVKDDKTISIYRSANLSGATAATLTYDLSANTLDNVLDVIKLQASNNGGASWTDLRAFTKGTIGSGSHNLITALGSVTSDTRIRFTRVSSSGGAKQIEVDNLLLSYTSPNGGVTATSLSADTALLSGSRNVTVSMKVTSSVGALVTSPDNLTVSATGTAGATKVSGPSSANGQADSSGVTFTYVYQVNSGAGIGSVRFSGVPAGPSGFNFNTATSQSVLTTAPLSFKAKVTAPTPGSGPILNTASITGNGGTITADSPRTSAATEASIGDIVWLDNNGDGLRDPGEPCIAGVTVRVHVDADKNGVPDGAAVGTAVTDVAGNYQISGLDAGDYLAIYDATTAPTGYYPTTAPSHPVYGLVKGQQYLTADFGVKPAPANPASVGDTVWIDANNDGVLNTGEFGIADVNVQLYADWNNDGVVDSGDAHIATTSTDTSGAYQFSNLSEGHYVVRVDTADPQFPAGITLVTGGNPVITAPANGVWDVDLVADQNLVTADFGYSWTGEIGRYVWWDANHDGVQDGGELPVAGALVTLYVDENHNRILDGINGDYQISTTYTDANGAYLFSNLPAGDYLVDVDEASIAVVGDKPVPSTRDIVAKSLAAGERDLSSNFGYFQGALVIGDVFWDANHDSIFESDESGLTPVTVTLTGTDMIGNPVSATTATDANGHFSIIVPEGDYTLTYTSADVTTLAPALTDATTTTTYTFHAYPGEDWISYCAFGVDNAGRIGDTIFVDANGNGAQDGGEAGLADVTVELYQDINNDNLVDDGDVLLDMQLTDANGNYLFSGLADGNHVVNVLRATVPGGYDTNPTAHPSGEWTSGSMAGATVTGGATLLDRDFGYHPTAAVFGVSGNIWNDNGSGGGISGDGAKNGAEPDFPGIIVTISVDADGAGPNPSVVFTVMTDASGNYSLNGIADTAKVVISVNTATLPGAAAVNTGDPDGVKNSTTTFTMAGADVSNNNFGYLNQYGSIAGSVVKGNGDGLAGAGEPVIANVVVTLTFVGPDAILGTADDLNFNATTDANGDYSFANLQPGDYAITTTIPSTCLAYADRDGFNTNHISLSLPPGGNMVDQDFEYKSKPTAISGHVMADTNNDKVGDAALAGVTVTLLADPNGDGNPADGAEYGTPATTAEDGSYRFNDVPPGSYVVVETDLAGYASVEDGDSTSDIDGSPADAANISPTDNLLAVSLLDGESDSGNDFVDIQYGSIAGTVRKDTEDNGSGDAPLADVVLTLHDGSGNLVDGDPGTAGIQLVTVTTAADGTYRFANVLPAVYQVRETQPSDYLSVSDVDGGNPDLIGDVAPLIVAPGQDVTDRDFVEIQFGAISGYAYRGSDLLVGVTVTLLDANGDPVDGDPNTPGVQPITTVTDSDGFYMFSNLRPGIYQVGIEDAGGEFKIIGDVTPVVVLPGQTNTDNKVIKPAEGATGWDQWRNSEFAQDEPLSGPEDDPDHDGANNLIEYVFGTSPKEAGPPSSTTVELVNDGGSDYLQMTIPRRIDRPATLDVELSTDLIKWDPAEDQISTVSSTPEALVVRYLTPVGPLVPRLFMRVRISLPEP